jgi:hypothetical protein
VEQCLNCTGELRGRYCHACGQRAGPLAPSLRALIAAAIKETLSLDGRLTRSLVPFLFRPGFLVAEYISGRRVRYTSPLRLYLIALLLGFLTFRWSSPTGGSENWDVQFGDPAAARPSPDRPADAPQTRPADAPRTRPAPRGLWLDLGDAGEVDGPIERLFGDSLAFLRRLSPTDRGRVLGDAVFDAAPTIFTLLVPLFALVGKALFPRRSYVEHALFALHVHAIALLTFAAAALVGQPIGILVAALIVEVHVAFGLRRVFAAGWPRTLASTGVLAVAHLALLLAMGLGALATALATLQ